MCARETHSIVLKSDMESRRICFWSAPAERSGHIAFQLQESKAVPRFACDRASKSLATKDLLRCIILSL